MTEDRRQRTKDELLADGAEPSSGTNENRHKPIGTAYRAPGPQGDRSLPPIESQWIECIINDKADAFERLFYTYGQPLINFTSLYVKDIQVAENLVQDVFVRVWTKRKQLDPAANIKAYLYKAAKNEALKYLRHEKVVTKNIKDIHDLSDPIKTPENILGEKELALAVQKAIEELPEKSRLVFSMSKYDNLTYSEIAEIQNISKKTVETHIGRALKYLRQRLANFFVRENQG